MLTRILSKRTRQERKAWQQVLDLMPRSRKTRGIQYQALEFLFSHLYEDVAETLLREHLLELRGHLQATGDPIKGAINLAVKELQRLPDRPFELVKIQENGPTGRMTRFVRLVYTRFDNVVGFQQYREYLEDLLMGERHLVMRTIWGESDGASRLPFPGLEGIPLENTKIYALLNVSAATGSASHSWDCRYVPDSPAVSRFLLLYENETTPIPFLAFMCDHKPARLEAGARFILYRGKEKLSKLKFLNEVWQQLYGWAIKPDQLARLLKEANRLGDKVPELERETLLIALASRHIKAMAHAASVNNS